MKRCVFAGTFDPPTTGHKKIIDICLQLFDEVVVAIGVNTAKTPFLDVDERKELLEKLFQGEKKVKVVTYDGATVDLLERENTRYFVRGVRNTVDFEYENANFFANKKLKNDIVTIYIPAEQDSLHISSTLVRNSHKFKKEFADYIPDKILPDLMKILNSK